MQLHAHVGAHRRPLPPQRGDLCQPWASETATPSNAAQGFASALILGSPHGVTETQRAGAIIGVMFGARRTNGPCRRNAATYASPGPVRRQRRRTQPRVASALILGSPHGVTETQRAGAIIGVMFGARRTNGPCRRNAATYASPGPVRRQRRRTQPRVRVRPDPRKSSRRHGDTEGWRIIGVMFGARRTNGPCRRNAATYASPGPVRRQRRRTQPRVRVRPDPRKSSRRHGDTEGWRHHWGHVRRSTHKRPLPPQRGDLCQPWASETATPSNAAQGSRPP